MTTEEMDEVQVAEFLHRFTDDILEVAVTSLATPAAYDALQGLSFEEWSLLIRKILIGCMGRLN
jgi:hypothetical protein